MNARLWADEEPVQVESDAHGRPLRCFWRGQTHRVAQVCNRWRVHEGWWRRDGNDDGGVWREYIKLITEDGLLCVLARDLDEDAWRLVRLYD